MPMLMCKCTECGNSFVANETINLKTPICYTCLQGLRDKAEWRDPLRYEFNSQGRPTLYRNEADTDTILRTV